MYWYAIVTSPHQGIPPMNICTPDDTCHWTAVNTAVTGFSTFSAILSLNCQLLYTFRSHTRLSQVCPAEFIGFIESQNPLHIKGEPICSHDELMANFFAQVSDGAGRHAFGRIN